MAREGSALLEEALDALPSGSHIAITHPTADFNAEEMAAAVGAASQGGMMLVPGTRGDVTRFFDGWQLVEPGVVPARSLQRVGPHR